MTAPVRVYVRKGRGPARWKPRSEKIEQAGVIGLLAAAGFTVRPTSQYRASGVALGIPDLILFHRRAGRTGWFEVKKAKALASYSPFDETTWDPEPLSPSQVEFQSDCILTGAVHGWGTVRDARTFLVALDLAYWRDDTFWLRPASRTKPR